MRAQEANKRVLVNQRAEQQLVDEIVHKNELLGRQVDRLNQANDFKTRSEAERMMVSVVSYPI